MRTLFIILVILNLGLFAVGQGWFGTPRAQKGRTPAANIAAPLNADAVKIGPGQLQTR
jgi:hypothetical protein